jgi:hypothetical protein
MRQLVLKALMGRVRAAIGNGGCQWTVNDPRPYLLECARLTLCYNVLLKSYPPVLPRNKPPPPVIMMRRLPGALFSFSLQQYRLRPWACSHVPVWSSLRYFVPPKQHQVERTLKDAVEAMKEGLEVLESAKKTIGAKAPYVKFLCRLPVGHVS